MLCNSLLKVAIPSVLFKSNNVLINEMYHWYKELVQSSC